VFAGNTIDIKSYYAHARPRQQFNIFIYLVQLLAILTFPAEIQISLS